MVTLTRWTGLGALACAPLLASANGTAPAAAAVSAPAVIAAPAPAEASVDAEHHDALARPSLPLAGAGLGEQNGQGGQRTMPAYIGPLPTVPAEVPAPVRPAPDTAEPRVEPPPAVAAPGGMPGWMPFVPYYGIPVWAPPVPPHFQVGGVTYVLMWVPVPLAAAGVPAGAPAGAAPQAGLPGPVVPASTPAALAPRPPVEATGTATGVTGMPAVTPSIEAAPVEPAPREAAAANAVARSSESAPVVDYGPVAPTPVIYLRRAVRAPVATPARASTTTPERASTAAPARASAPPAEPAPAPRRRMCWNNGVVEPCR